ncbi:DUF58 domain-containing protein [Thermodesulfobacteriota bacterium]
MRPSPLHPGKKAGTSQSALPQTLDRKRVYIFPTRFGFVFILVLFAMLLGSMNHNNNLGFLLTFLLSGMVLVSILHTYRNMIGLKVLSVAAAPVFAQETAVFDVRVRVENIPRTAISCGFSSSDAVHLDLPVGKDKRLSIRVPAGRRGIFVPGLLIISSRYPFGLFRAWAKLRPDTECVVYPKPISGPWRWDYDESLNDGEGKAGGYGVDDFHGLTPYQPGDSLQHISWKTYSRGQGLFTKVFTDQTGSSVVLDWNAIREPDVERKLSILCDMVLKAHSLNLAYGLKLPGKTLEPDTGEAHKRSCLKALAFFGLNPG